MPSERFGSPEDTPAPNRFGSTSDRPAAGGVLTALGRGALHGLANPLYGAAQIGARMQEPTAFTPVPDPEQAEAVDKAAREREAKYRVDPTVQAHPIASGIGEFGGELAANAPLMAIPGGQATTAGRLGVSALGGALASTMQPITKDDFWTEKLKDVTLGGALGAAGGAATEAVGRAVAPKMGDDATELARRGVSMTLGQAVGGIPRRAEEAAKSLPVLGSFIRGAEGRSIDSFNRAVINQTLEPIGKSVPKDAKAGHELVGFAAEKISDAYDALLPTLDFRIDVPFQQGLVNLSQLTRTMPPAQATQFQNLVNDRVIGRLLGPAGQQGMDGETMKQVESELRKFGSEYRRAADPAQRQLGQAVDEVRRLIRQALTRQNPTAAKALNDIDYSYAMLTRVEDAAGRRLGSDGRFRPIDLLAAAKKGDDSVRDRAFAHGDALFQEFARIGQRVLPGQLPDSGTPERAMWDALGLLGAGAGGALDWRIPLTVAAGVAPYTKMGQAAVNRYIQPSFARQTVRQGFLAADPYAGVAAGLLGTEP